MSLSGAWSGLTPHVSALETHSALMGPSPVQVHSELVSSSGKASSTIFPAFLALGLAMSINDVQGLVG